MTDVNPQLMGWLGVDEIQRTFAAQFPALRQSSPRLFAAPPSHQTVCLYRAYYDVLGQDWQGYPSQEIGDCVSFGHGHGNDLLQCIAVGLGGKSGYFETQTEFIYGASREVAGILGGGDGSYGAAAVKAMARYLAVLVYPMPTHGEAWVDRGATRFEQRRSELELTTLNRKARARGFRLVPIS